MKRILALCTALAAMMLGIVTVASPAGAHTPSVTAKCDSLGVTLSSYATHNGKTNSVKVTIDGTVVENTTFGASYSKTFTLTPNYVAHTWAVDVDAWDSNQYDVHKSGTTTPCDRPKPQQPPADVEHKDFVTTADCSITTVQHVWQDRERSYSFDTASWTYKPGDWSAWHTVKSEDVTNSAYPCPKPPVVTPPKTTPHPPVVHFTPHIRVIDRCRCTNDSVRVRHAQAIQFFSIRQVSKTAWRVRMVAADGYLIPQNVRKARSAWVSSTTYVFHTTNKPCPCEAHGCKAKPKPKPKPAPCACARKSE